MSSTAKVARWSATVASAAWIGALFLAHLEISGLLRRALTYLPAIIGLAVVVFDLWAWKWPGINRLAARPRIYGTWKAALTPSSDSHIPDGGNRAPVGALVVEQTYFTLSARFHTEQSDSRTVTATLIADLDSKQSRTFYATYVNQAQQQHNARSYPHTGTFRLAVHGNDPHDMDGTYWTDRLTAGDMRLTRIGKQTDLTRQQALDAARTSTDLP